MKGGKGDMCLMSNVCSGTEFVFDMADGADPTEPGFSNMLKLEKRKV